MILQRSRRSLSILATLALFALMALITGPASQGSTQTTYDRMEGLSVVESADWGGHPMSYIKGSDGSGLAAEVVCEGIEDPDCKNKILGVAAYLLPCSPGNTLACIEEVYAIDNTGKRTDASFVKTIAKNDVNDFAEDVSKGLIAGAGQGGIWELPGIIHGGGVNQYAVQVRLAGWIQEVGSQKRYESANIAISAVQPISGEYSQKTIVVNPESGRVAFGGSSDNCVMTERGLCYDRVKMPSDQRFGIKVRLPNELSGWFHGRIYRPEFALEREGNTYLYQIEASPVNVPEVEKRIPVSQWSPEFTEYVKGQWPMSNGSGMLMPGNFGKLSLELTKRFLPMVQDKATASGDYWVARTLDGFGNGNLTESVSPRILECSSDKSKVSGVVTTNAMVFSFGPPSYNPATGSLDYTVLSPHVDENGKENVGSYDLLINSEVARCIYGFTSAPVKAEIQVIGSDGNAKVATTVLGERDGWLFLSANGFTYSEPTIRVKLSQEAPPKPESTPAASASPQPAPKETVSSATVVKSKAKCIRGTKSVKPTKGKCPKGFKRSR
jgi:hypothetical protein